LNVQQRPRYLLSTEDLALDKPNTNASHARALQILKRRGGEWSEVWLRNGRRVRVLNIAWGYDLGDPVAHVTTNISPSLAGADLPVDFFRTDEVVRIVDPEDGAVWFDTDDGRRPIPDCI
jgi:hypothetical protein